MTSYRDLFEVHLRYVDYIREKSLLIHQYIRNISLTGSGVETEVRELLGSVLPDRFKVTSGYIVGADRKDQEPNVSPQVDVVIVDTLVPHSLWIVDSTNGVEVIPRESVVGVIEVKRTLDTSSLVAAVDHLAKTVNAVGLRKNNGVSIMPGGLVLDNSLTGPYKANPLLGIIGLVAGDAFETSPGHELLSAVDNAEHPETILDFALAFSGSFTATATPGTTNYEAMLVQDTLSTTWAETSRATGSSARVALAQGLGFIQTYIGNTCGRVANAANYFFNDHIA